MISDLRKNQFQPNFLFIPSPELAQYKIGSHLVETHEKFDMYLTSIMEKLAAQKIVVDKYYELYGKFPKDFILLLGIDRAFWHKKDHSTACPCGDPKTSTKSITSSGRPYVE